MCLNIFSLVLIQAVFAALPFPAPAGLPEAPVAFTQREVFFQNGATRLAGTVHVPDVERRCPAVVILGGAERGPRGAYKKALATHFAGRSIATLIYDSPGTGGSGGMALMQTKMARVREALAAHEFLRKQAGIDPEKVGIYGISEGAGIALLAAKEGEGVAFALSVSGGLGIPPMELARYRVEMMCMGQGLGSEEIQKALVFLEVQFALISGLDIVEWPLIRLKAKQWPDEPWNELIDLTKRCRGPLQETEMRGVKEGLVRAIGAWKSEPWFNTVVVDEKRYEQFMAAEPGPFFAFLKSGPFAQGDWHHNRRELCTLPEVRCPVLAVWGREDRFVPANRSAAVFRDCMSDSKNDDVTLRIISGASHLITVPGTGLDFTGDYLRILSDWILSSCSSSKPR